MNLSMNDLIEVGDEIITAESERACRIFERALGDAAVKRSKLNVYTCFCRMDEKRWRMFEQLVAREMSNSRVRKLWNEIDTKLATGKGRRKAAN